MINADWPSHMRTKTRVKLYSSSRFLEGMLPEMGTRY